MSQLDLIDGDVINKDPGRSSPTMESKNIITSTNNIERIEFVVRESGLYGWHDVTVPEDFYDSRSFAFGAAESASLKECDSIGLTGNCFKGFCRCEGSRQGVKSNRRAEKTNSVTGMCVRSIMEDSRVEVSSKWASTDPVGVTWSKGKIALAWVIAFESAIDDIIYSFVSPRIGDC